MKITSTSDKMATKAANTTYENVNYDCWVWEIMKSYDVGSYDYHIRSATHVRARPTL